MKFKIQSSYEIAERLFQNNEIVMSENKPDNYVDIVTFPNRKWISAKEVSERINKINSEIFKYRNKNNSLKISRVRDLLEEFEAEVQNE